MPNNEITPGVKTTEFWMTIIAQALPLLVLLQVVPADDVDMLTKALSAIIGGLISLTTLVSYIMGRLKLKQEALKLQTQEAKTQEVLALETK